MNYNNIRTPVTTQEILKYLRFKERRLYETIFNDNKTPLEIKINKIRMSEINKLIDFIVNDKIRDKINIMKKHHYKPKGL